jgi:Glutaredoxin-like domain (DUF836)
MTAKPRIQFITKEEGCTLCDEAFEELESAMDYVEFDLEIVKIRKGDELWERYWDKIPIILINDKVAFTHRTTRDLLIRKLRPRSKWKFW